MKLGCCVSLSLTPQLSVSRRLAMTSQGQNLNSSSDDNCTMDFRQKLLFIDSHLGDQDVERLRFLCRDCVSHKKLEKSSSALEIFLPSLGRGSAEGGRQLLPGGTPVHHQAEVAAVPPLLHQRAGGELAARPKEGLSVQVRGLLRSG